jgi:hypothetical protein
MLNKWALGGCCCDEEEEVDCNTSTYNDPLTLTDVNTSISLFKTSNAPPTWQGSYYLTTTSVGVVDVDGLGSCFASMPTSGGPVLICYTCVCNGDGTFSVTRSWRVIQERFTTNWHYVKNSTTNAPTQGTPCPFNYGGFFCAVGRVVADTAATTLPGTASSPFVWSGAPLAAGTNKTADPVGGVVAVG